MSFILIIDKCREPKDFDKMKDLKAEFWENVSDKYDEYSSNMEGILASTEEVSAVTSDINSELTRISEREKLYEKSE